MLTLRPSRAQGRGKGEETACVHFSSLLCGEVITTVFPLQRASRRGADRSTGVPFLPTDGQAQAIRPLTLSSAAFRSNWLCRGTQLSPCQYVVPEPAQSHGDQSKANGEQSADADMRSHMGIGANQWRAERRH